MEALQQVTGCKGSLNRLLAVVLEDHIRTHLIDAELEDEHGSGNEWLIEVVHSYFKLAQHDKAIAGLSLAYADQNEADHAAPHRTIRHHKLEATTEDAQ